MNTNTLLKEKSAIHFIFMQITAKCDNYKYSESWQFQGRKGETWFGQHLHRNAYSTFLASWLREAQIVVEKVLTDSNRAPQRILCEKTPAQPRREKGFHVILSGSGSQVSLACQTNPRNCAKGSSTWESLSAPRGPVFSTRVNSEESI